MPKVNDIKLGGRMVQLNIGPPGAGKTTGAGSYPGPIMFLDLDQRVAPLKKMFPNDTTMEYESFGPFDFLRFWERINQLRQGNAPFKTYVLDSLIALARMTLNYSVGLRTGEKRNTEYKKRGVIDLLEIEDFGAEGRLLGHVIDVFRNLGRSNFILNAHLIETSSTDIKTKQTTTTQTLLTGGKKIAAEIPSYFNEVYYFFTRDTMVDSGPDYFISTVPMDDIMCKTALPLPPTIKFTMNEKEKGGLFQKIQEACKEKGIEIG